MITATHTAAGVCRAEKIGKGMEEFGKHSLNAPVGQGTPNNVDDVFHY